MINDSNFPTYLTHAQLIGMIIIAFGVTLLVLALRRKYLRGRVQGIQKFALTDRSPFSRKSENLLQKIGLLMVIAGVIAITFDAIRQEDQSAYQPDAYRENIQQNHS
ncbi:hypothetical protein [Pedobacter frigidisoli]|uniref:hypothetical protein n=1 Tax=Pedobacter frigidisoli TaxID=2530455 RepID=UPI002930CF3F|nr:hypothetical protein [Pedobacter frigidisoli]